MNPDIALKDGWRLVKQQYFIWWHQVFYIPVITNIPDPILMFEQDIQNLWLTSRSLNFFNNVIDFIATFPKEKNFYRLQFVKSYLRTTLTQKVFLVSLLMEHKICKMIDYNNIISDLLNWRQFYDINI